MRVKAVVALLPATENLSEQVSIWLQGKIGVPVTSKSMNNDKPQIQNECAYFEAPDECWMLNTDDQWEYLCNFVVCGGDGDSGTGGNWPPDDPFADPSPSDPSSPTPPPGGGNPEPGNDPPSTGVELPCPGDPIVDPEIAPTKGKSGRKGGLFGCTRLDPMDICNNIKGKKYHKGIDILASVGTSVFAQYDGVINKIRNNSYSGDKRRGGIGNFVNIKYIVEGKAYFVTYGHLSSVSVAEDQIVKRGHVLGTTGVTGNANGTVPHLHVKAMGFPFDNNGIIDPQLIMSTSFKEDGTINQKPCE